jgi:hypothetical protein
MVVWGEGGGGRRLVLVLSMLGDAESEDYSVVKNWCWGGPGGLCC